jgi:hypothetical protein
MGPEPDWTTRISGNTSMQQTKQTQWPYSASELYRPSDRHLSIEECGAVRTADPLRP